MCKFIKNVQIWEKYKMAKMCNFSPNLAYMEKILKIWKMLNWLILDTNSHIWRKMKTYFRQLLSTILHIWKNM